MVAVFESVLLVLWVGQTVCAEAGSATAGERAAIAQVVKNRSDGTTRSMIAELWRPHQFAHRCRGDPDFGALARRAPPWARQAIAFASRRAAQKVKARWQRRGLQVIAVDTANVFFRTPALGAGFRSAKAGAVPHRAGGQSVTAPARPTSRRLR